MARIALFLALVAGSLPASFISALATSHVAAQAAPGRAPILLWKYGGCYRSWCETGWYSSPAVADLNRDGNMEVVAAAYSVWSLDGKTGRTIWRVASGHDIHSPDAASAGRVWPDVVVADVNGSGYPEIVTADSGGDIAVYDRRGSFVPGWPRQPVTDELRALAVADLDGTGKMSIAVGVARPSQKNIWVYNANGTVRAGWPQAGGSGEAAGVYNDNIAIGRLGSMTRASIVVPSDVITVAAYDPSGKALRANARYGRMAAWSQVPAYVDPAYELQGYGPCYTQFTPRANFADSPAVIADLNGDGENEVVVVGNVHDCHTSPYTDLYDTPFVFNSDRSRWHAGAFDWSTPPRNTGAPLSEDYDKIETAEPNPVTVSLDGKPQLETLFASYDGKLHAFWPDKTEHGHWPFDVSHTSDGYITFASEPVVADLYGTGTPDVLFATWTQKGSNRTGRLFILDNMGNVLQSTPLPRALGDVDWNGSLAAPALARLGRDSNLDIVLNTAGSGVVAYELPGTAGARILWGTGRGNYQRTGSAPIAPER